MNIRPLKPGEEPPMELLLLADPDESVLRTYLSKSCCRVMETENGEIAGVYLLLPTRPQTAEIVNIAVREAEQGKGLGKRLVLHAIQTAGRLGCSIVEIGTGNSSVGQLALYQRCGFRIVGVDPDYFIRHYTEPIYENGIRCRDMIRLRLHLGADMDGACR